jgi:hypothetical protein
MDRRIFLVFSVVAAFATSLLQAQQPCPSLLKSSSSTVSITLATVIETGPYPQAAHYNGSGSIDDASSFSCKAAQ